MTETLISVENVGKKYCRSLKRSLWYGVQDLSTELLGTTTARERKLRQGEFWATRNVSFQLDRGQALGLIGRNGAGKTTLLRMLNGLIKPDRGRIEMRGQVGALIALGAGFNPVLTGRENVYVAGAVLGFGKRELARKFEEIVEFAELSDFIDAPVSSYSSGMAVRLGFAVASTLKPDILLLDEVLAVGDVGFRTKCYNRVHELAQRSAVIFVSHNMAHVDWVCSRAIFLETGEVRFIGEVAHAIDLYNGSFSTSGGDWQIAPGVMLEAVKINGSPVGSSLEVKGGESFTIELTAEFPHDVERLEVGLTFLQPSYELVAQINNRHAGLCIANMRCRQIVRIALPNLPLGSGQKLISLDVLDADTNRILLWAHAMWSVRVSNTPFVGAPIRLGGEIISHKA
jgi:lipopolysaccharide transport system ATP-binding protein